MGYARLNKSLPANKFAEFVKRTGYANIQVMDKDAIYFRIWKKAVEHNGCRLCKASYPMNKPWGYMEFCSK